MCISCKSNEKRHSAQNAYTIIELLVVILIVGFVAAVHGAVRGKHGEGPALLASLLAVGVSALLVVLSWDWDSRSNKRRLTQLREQYRSIYQVKELPTNAKSIVKLAAAEIQIGDYGWDARPNRKDGLIHLQGLTPKWQVVWHAGFRPDQIEKVAVKPVSQYDYWAPHWVKPPPPPPCPYPVRERNTPTLGLPHHSGRYFEHHPSQHHSQYYQSPKDVPKTD
jgi:prepilin-type N-terminal cleavage/methylation domain-containing protein